MEFLTDERAAELTPPADYCPAHWRVYWSGRGCRRCAEGQPGRPDPQQIIEQLALADPPPGW